MIWKQPISLEGLNQVSKNTLVEHLDIEFVEFGDDFITAKMPVDHRTVQPMRLLHGGASAALAETVGSTASVMCLPDMATQAVVGVELNINHLSSAKEGQGFVFARATPAKVGRTIHVWQIEIRDETDRLISVSRLTIAVVSRRS
ncbi:MAG: hotdog fold thioesterase [Saprospiraceae bacterium]|nr:hotdog fold thioesterase [Saprospiraceae bacterium]